MLPVLLLVLLVGVLAGCASKTHNRPAGAASVAGGTATTSITFRAYNRTGQLAVRVAAEVRGQCWTTSAAVPVAGAYRCFEGNKILDPCFAPAHPATPPVLACMADPWSRALMLRVSGALPQPADGDAASRPWAFELSNGARCVASTGTVPAVAGENLGYHCTDRGNAALVDDGSATVTAHYAPAGAKTLQSMNVTTIWHA